MRLLDFSPRDFEQCRFTGPGAPFGIRAFFLRGTTRSFWPTRVYFVKFSKTLRQPWAFRLASRVRRPSIPHCFPSNASANEHHVFHDHMVLVEGRLAAHEAGPARPIE